MTTPRELKALYDQGANISAYLRSEHAIHHNTVGIIEASYDLQTGSYIREMQDPALTAYKDAYARDVAAVLRSLGPCASLLEAGIGEGTTLSGVLQHLGQPVRSYGFDLSWSRLAYARRWLQQNGGFDTVLCTGDLLAMPFGENSIDIVYTSHAAEPNGGKESAILQQLYRVARRYVVLLEPGYEFASQIGRAWMERHGYVRDLAGTARSLGYDVLRHELFPHAINPDNPTALTILRKDPDAPLQAQAVLACPQYGVPLELRGGMYYSSEALSVYPVIGGIPCLRPENAVRASKYPEFY